MTLQDIREAKAIGKKTLIKVTKHKTLSAHGAAHLCLEEDTIHFVHVYIDEKEDP